MFNNDSIVIVCYPPWSGGKFLINCLALSNDCYFQDLAYVKRQRAGLLPSQEKFNLLNSELDLVSDSWNDLRMGCAQLFTQADDPSKFDPVITELANESKLFFVVAHKVKEFDKLRQIWPRARIIFFQENNRFLTWRCKHTGTATKFHSEFGNMDDKIVWHADYCLDPDVFLIKLKELYQKLMLPDFNESLVFDFYSRYMSTLKFLEHDLSN